MVNDNLLELGGELLCGDLGVGDVARRLLLHVGVDLIHLEILKKLKMFFDTPI